MKNNLSTSSEVERLGAVARYAILDTPPEEPFDRITKLAAHIFQVPVALVSILDRDRIWFKSRYGIGLTELPRGTEPLASALLQKEPFFIEDACDTQALIFPANHGEARAKVYVGGASDDTGWLQSGCLMLDRYKASHMEIRGNSEFAGSCRACHGTARVAS